ncbi:NADPH-dependent FMN reductase [Pararhizobium mangrovi]|uniref:NAD(P)H-dependent oxidoreductase n=1 Tax=Pararhizobium mangrovi TaxID=2590452 RepID=A0A506U3P1_9HYPH|nr:NAD(P)H-dependent oxidoreductase [Pararhizobium mangrovi]TPW26507.1 NAD(P)H-dependent oxidoreductase [Pararhizobium mangrovi]
MALRLQTVICSTRPGRIGPSMAQWFDRFAEQEGSFETEIVDLAEFSFPVFDEPNHPRLGQYENDHTKRWSQTVDRADAFVFVTPEYNHGPSPSLLNALTYLSREWNYKPAGFVSYGGIAGGVRAVQETKSTLVTLKMFPLVVEGVIVPMVQTMLDDDKVFHPNEMMEKGADAMLKELHRVSEALKGLRT